MNSAISMAGLVLAVILIPIVLLLARILWRNNRANARKNARETLAALSKLDKLPGPELRLVEPYEAPPPRNRVPIRIHFYAAAFAAAAVAFVVAAPHELVQRSPVTAVAGSTTPLPVNYATANQPLPTTTPGSSTLESSTSAAIVVPSTVRRAASTPAASGSAASPVQTTPQAPTAPNAPPLVVTSTVTVAVPVPQPPSNPITPPAPDPHQFDGGKPPRDRAGQRSLLANVIAPVLGILTGAP